MSKEYVLGIDIGGSLTKLGLVDREGEVLQKKIFHTEAHKPFKTFMKRLKEEVDTLKSYMESADRILHIGVGAPNANPLSGNIEYPPNLKWGDQTPIVEHLQKAFSLPVTLANDANASALGEMRFGSAVGMKNFVVLTLGTGLGSGLVINGRLVIGQHGAAGELGHVTANPVGRQCNCGRKGCLETYASVTGIRRTVFELLAEMTEDSELRGFSFDDLNGENISDAALEGDVVALEAFSRTADVLGSKMADTVAHLDPEAFILAGGLSKAGHVLLDPLIASMERNLFSPYKGKVNVLLSKATRADAVLGPAAMAWYEVEKVQYS